MDDQGRRGGVSDQFQDLWEVGVPLPGELRERSAGPQLGTADRGQPHRRARDRGDRRVASAALYGPGDRRAARPAALDGLGDPDPDRDGPARPVGPGAGRALRARAPGRVDPYRRQEARTHPGRRRQAGLRRALALHRQLHRRRRTRAAQGRLGLRARRHRRLHPAGLRRGPGRREGQHGDRISGPRDRVLRPSRDHRRARDDRQRLRLRLDHPRDRLPRPRDPPPAHPPPPAADQRQGRALHPHHARRLGLRRDLPRQPRTHRSP